MRFANETIAYTFFTPVARPNELPHWAGMDASRNRDTFFEPYRFGLE